MRGSVGGSVGGWVGRWVGGLVGSERAGPLHAVDTQQNSVGWRGGTRMFSLLARTN